LWRDKYAEVLRIVRPWLELPTLWACPRFRSPAFGAFYCAVPLLTFCESVSHW